MSVNYIKKEKKTRKRFKYGTSLVVQKNVS